MTKQEFFKENYRFFMELYTEFSNEWRLGEFKERWKEYRELTLADEFIQFERKISKDGDGRAFKISIPKNIQELVPTGKKYLITIEKIREDV